VVGQTPPLTPMCLCFVTRGAPSGSSEVLLGLKKRGFGAGRIVGLGGHVEPGESAARAAAREVAEESGLIVAPRDLRLLAVVTFRFPARPAWDQRVTVFGTDRFGGRAAESDEISPRWVPVGDLPWDEMWDDAAYWLPRALAGEYQEPEFTFAEDCETVEEVRFADVSSARPGGPAARIPAPGREPSAQDQGRRP
jgi:8-oxo-dGTP diphosphatase